MNPIPILPSGTVYGPLLDFRREHAVDAAHERCAVQDSSAGASALYQDHRHLLPSGHGIALPRGMTELDVNASLGLVPSAGGQGLELRVHGVLKPTVALAERVRDAATLWTDVNVFQTMRPGASHGAGEYSFAAMQRLIDGIDPGYHA